MSESAGAKNKVIVHEAFEAPFYRRDYTAAEGSGHRITFSTSRISSGAPPALQIDQESSGHAEIRARYDRSEGNLVIVHGRFSGFIAAGGAYR